MASLLRSMPVGLVKDTCLSEDQSIQSLLIVINRLKRVELSNGRALNTEVTKRHLSILEALAIEP